MNKSETLTHLRDAKKAHIKWVQRAKALIEGLPVEKEQVPVDCTECMFGKWFYSDAQELYAIPNMTSLKEIEKLHFELHDVYMKIFKIYFTNTNRSFFSKIFGSKKSVNASEQEIAQEYFKNLRNISEALVLVIERLERRIHALGDATFNA